MGLFSSIGPLLNAFLKVSDIFSSTSMASLTISTRHCTVIMLQSPASQQEARLPVRPQQSKTSRTITPKALKKRPPTLNIKSTADGPASERSNHVKVKSPSTTTMLSPGGRSSRSSLPPCGPLQPRQKMPLQPTSHNVMGPPLKVPKTRGNRTAGQPTTTSTARLRSTEKQFYKKSTLDKENRAVTVPVNENLPLESLEEVEHPLLDQPNTAPQLKARPSTSNSEIEATGISSAWKGPPNATTWDESGEVYQPNQTQEPQQQAGKRKVFSRMLGTLQGISKSSQPLRNGHSEGSLIRKLSGRNVITKGFRSKSLDIVPTTSSVDATLSDIKESCIRYLPVLFPLHKHLTS